MRRRSEKENVSGALLSLRPVFVLCICFLTASAEGEFDIPVHSVIECAFGTVEMERGDDSVLLHQVKFEVAFNGYNLNNFMKYR